MCACVRARVCVCIYHSISFAYGKWFRISRITSGIGQLSTGILNLVILHFYSRFLYQVIHTGILAALKKIPAYNDEKDKRICLSVKPIYRLPLENYIIPAHISQIRRESIFTCSKLLKIAGSSEKITQRSTVRFILFTISVILYIISRNVKTFHVDTLVLSHRRTLRCQ